MYADFCDDDGDDHYNDCYHHFNHFKTDADNDDVEWGYYDQDVDNDDDASGDNDEDVMIKYLLYMFM